MERNTSIVEAMIINARNHLLDTSFNNRMINSKITQNKGLSFNVENLDKFYELVAGNNSFTFLPLENKKTPDSNLTSSDKVNFEYNKNIEKVGIVDAVCILDTTKKPSILSLKSSIDEGDSKLMYKVKGESAYIELVEKIYEDIKKNFTKYGIDEDNVYNKDMLFSGFKKKIENDIDSIKLSLYIAFLSILKNEGIPKDYIFFGGINKKNEITQVSNLIDKLIFAGTKGFKKALVPKKNKKDIANLPSQVAENLEIVFVSNIDEAVLSVFDMVNSVEHNDLSNDFILNKKNQPQKIFYVNYNQDDLRSRMEEIYLNSKRHIEEQGINILFLSLGFTQWRSPVKPEEIINSPLIFIPVNIEISNYKNIYKISYSNSEIILNKSLIKKLELEFNINFDELLLDVVDERDFEVSKYIEKFMKITRESGNDFGMDSSAVHLSFYSYSKFLMYNDLDPINWEDVLQGEEDNVLTDIFVNHKYHEVSDVDDKKLIDSNSEIDMINNVLDADSSQLLAISKVNRGNSIIIQGPPGTGKSQTIVNLISEGIIRNKKILFMSEKLAAMDVVYSRLRSLNLSHVALQLHSDKVNKSQVINELQKTYYMNKINVKNTDYDIVNKLDDLRREINNYYELLNKKSSKSKLSIVEAYRLIIKLENYFKINDIDVYKLDVHNEYLMESSEVQFDNLLSDLESLEIFYNKYGTMSDNPLTSISIEKPLSHHDMNKYKSQINELISELTSVTNKIAITKGNQTIIDDLSISNIKKILAVIEDHSSLLNNINNIDYPLLAENRDLLYDIFMNYWDSSEINNLIKSNIYNNSSAVDELLSLLEAISEETEFLKRNNSFLKRKSQNFKIHKDKIVSKYFNKDNVKLSDIETSLSWLYKKLYVKYMLIKEDELLKNIFGKRSRTDNIKIIASLFQSLEEIVKFLEKELNFENATIETYFKYLMNFATNDFSNLNSIVDIINNVTESLGIDLESIFSSNEFMTFKISEIIGEFGIIRDGMNTLNDIVALKEIKNGLDENITNEYLREILQNELYSKHISKVFSYIRYNSIVQEIMNYNSELENFNAMVFDQKIREFIYLDNRNIQVNNLQNTLDAHFYNVYDIRKDETLSVENKDDIISYLLQTFNRKYNVPTVKELLKKAFNPIIKLKPVFMMSPISVSQYLEPIVGMFDIVIFDEASQIKPQDAFGSLLRAKQVVVVGDEKQLPPTNFFESYYGITDTFVEDAVSNYESILTLIRGTGVPLTTLNWHYRSKHHNLIEISNKHFYGEELSIFPSKYKSNPDFGITYEYVDGSFDRGKSRTNSLEARRVAQEVIKHARNNPNLSLGVATININQRDLILSEIKKMRAKDHSLDDFFSEDRNEPFFVKNLESVQGDEREVIFVSIGYAKDQNGNIIQNFGAINHIGGERRLNVLMTRSRQKCVLFTGLKAADLEVDYNTAEGVKVLKKFLDFAERTSSNIETYKTSDTKEFSIEIAEELKKHGYNVTFNVGNSHYFVDIAVHNPNDESEYILGIEFDNSTYIQSRTAGERERIRNNIMRSKGWNIYKLYITSWFNNRIKEIDNILDYLSQIETEKIDYGEVVEFYEEQVNVATRFGFRPYKKFDKRIENIKKFVKEPVQIQKYVLDLITVESPIRLSTINSRILENSYLETKEKVFNGSVKKALSKLQESGVIYKDEGFYFISDRSQFIPFKDRRAIVGSFTLEDVREEEYIHAIREITKNSFGIDTENIATIISNYLGFDNINFDIHDRIERLSIRLVNSETLFIDKNNNLQLR
ncbi:DUF4011 domain-containing protein [Mycoplasmatota bacterium]|nr:DUF4011 domain-containing protein [Mycoplasmatota bacterium]